MLRATLTLTLASFGAAILWIRAQPAPLDTPYLGSRDCRPCHEDVHRAWRGSQHTKMMRPATAEVVVADLDPEHPDLLFDPAEVVWAIGGKWEQQFMGHDGATETLLPGAWLVERGEWLRKGWDGWEVPVPLQRCHGCHTVGLDVEDGSFVEPNIGCESCHGPGRWHAWTSGIGRIQSTADPQVCGQCHTRGTSPTGEFHFPVGYKPGLDLTESFVADQPTLGQTSATWWGNGRERKRHQQFAAWGQGGHANSLASLRDGYDGRYGTVTEECLACHAGDHILSSGLRRPGVEEAEHGITCAVCHNVHGELDRPRMECGDCHQGGAFYHRPELNDAHVACPAEAGVDCVGCHMPRVILNGGEFVMHSHAPGIVRPEEAARWDMPSSCANGGCHAGLTREELAVRFRAHYGGDYASALRAHEPASGSAP